MKLVGTTRLVDALAEWARHEAAGRNRDQNVSLDTELDAVELALRTRARSIWRILLAQPVDALRVQLEEVDRPRLIYAVPRLTPNAWFSQFAPTKAGSVEHIARLLPHKWTDAVLVSARKDDLAGQLVVFDGYHRIAAWNQKCDRGEGEPIFANLIVTALPIPNV